MTEYYRGEEVVSEEVAAEGVQNTAKAVVCEFSGNYFDRMRSKAHPAEVSFDGEFVQVQGGQEVGWFEVPLSALTLEPPLGKVRRKLKLPNGAHLETRDVAAFAKLEATSGKGRGLRFVHRLESHWRLTLGCLVGLAMSVGAFTLYGIPFLATQAAYATPLEVSEMVSQKSFDLLDGELFEPSTLSAERSASLQAQFESLTADFAATSDVQFSYELVFRSGGAIGANAFALPSGLIVVTDELIELAQDDREILSVLAHEVAHVEKRHGLRSLYGGAGVFLLVSVLAGDVASVTSIAASLPAILIESGYSRAFEREADELAGRYLVAKGWGTEPLQDILTRLTEGADVPTFLSSHPGTEARVEALRELE